MNRSTACLIWIFIVLGHFALGQRGERIELKADQPPGFQVVEQQLNSLQAVNRLDQVEMIDRQTPEGTFKEIRARGFGRSFQKGHPDLPQKTRLIRIPAGAKVEVNIKGYKEEVVSLDRRGIHGKIMPAQPSSPKRQDQPKKFHYNRQVYQTNRFLGKEPVRVREIGTMRGIRLGRLEISPFQYNPVTNQLRVFKDLEFEIDFTGGESSKSAIKAEASENPYYKVIEENTINKTKTGISTSANDGPFTYVIVSPPEFEDQLQPFVQWKRTKGFHVIEGYTDSIGNSQKEIKQFLKQLYEQPEQSPPSFVLLVGDVEQIPAWSGRTGGTHVTDLYYCEYTGDHLPEVFYGRFPARDTSQLKVMIDKTLEYEKYGMQDPSYLKEALLVAGNDEEYEDTYANGQINYGTTYYFNSENGINAHDFLQDPPNGNEAVRDSILNRVNSGMGFATYSAHCISEGWSNPSFQLDDIASLTDNGKFGLWISNCCFSVKFDDPESFGEAALRANNKGAIGAIGASDDTYWEEDYWWSVGLTGNILANPSYEETGLGVYDRMFHTHGEDRSEWYVTQGQMIAGGNLAVEASSSNLNNYYWEVYHLMGDPSLMPYLGIPDTLSVSHSPSGFTLGMDSITVETAPHTYVAISYNDRLMDAGTTDDEGMVGLSFPELKRPGELELVATGQNKQPYIKKVQVKPADQPYLILEKTTVQDSTGNDNGKVDYGESIGLDITLKNVSDSFAAYDVTDSLYTDDPYIEVTSSYKESGSVLPDTLSETITGFEFAVSDSVKDQHMAKFNLDIRGRDDEDSSYLWQSEFHLRINAPSLEIGELILDDGPGGNDSLDPGETVRLYTEIHNEGHAAVNNITGMLDIENKKDYLFIEDGEAKTGPIAANSTDTVMFRISAHAYAPEGVPVYCNISATGGSRGQYQASGRKRIILGEPAAYKISEADTIPVWYGLFYDSGGPGGNYSNDEDYKTTFIPEKNNHYLKVSFRSFDVESDFDTMWVYDGASTEAPLIGEYDSKNKPEVITAKGPSGALTFEFRSDQSITRTGWEAEIIGEPRDTLTFIISNGKSLMEGVEVVLAGDTSLTDSNGEVSFLLAEGSYEYNLTDTGYRDMSGSIEIQGSTERTLVMEKEAYEVTFELYDKDVKTPLDGEVFLDGSRVSTDQGSCTFEDVWVLGVHDFQAVAPGYQPDSGSFKLNSDTTINVALEKIRYPIHVIVEDEDGNPLDSVALVLDTLKTYTDQTGEVDLFLPEGNFTLSLHKDDYTEFTDELVITDTTSLTIKLSRLYTLAFNVISEADSQAIDSATIQIDTLNLRTDSLGKAITELTKGEYTFTVEAEGYKSYQSSINIGGDRTIQVALSDASFGGKPLDSQDVLLYPNPSSGLVKIRNKTNYSHLMIRVYNLTGNMIYSKITEGPVTTIDLRDQPEGMYLIRLRKDDNQITQKLLIE